MYGRNWRGGWKEWGSVEMEERERKYCFFFFNDTATTEIYTLSLHDALPISRCGSVPAFYTAHFSLRQRPGFLYCPFLVAAVPRLFILPISRCGSAPLFIQIGRAHV